MFTFRKVSFAFFCLLGVPSMALAQASVAGTVKDASGAVLPGVTVEASSPALIEGTRSVTTDGSGQYKIIDLRPGVYAVTFTLPGFSAVKREGIELTGSFAATVNAELKVGSVEETVNVTGESPIVDVQNVTKQRVMTSDVLDAIPTGRTQFNDAILIPGMTGTTDVGGTNNLQLATITLHGARAADMRVMIDGVSISNAEQAGNVSNFIPNMGSAQELSVDYSAGSADRPTAGVQINIVPREGGNVWAGSFFAAGTNSSFQGTNFTQDLKNRGLNTPDSLNSFIDVNPGGGGPLVRSKLWVYVSARYTTNNNNVGGLFYNLNAGNPNAWTYLPDTSRPAIYQAWQRDENGRLTWQLNPKNKISIYYDDQGRCQCPNTFGLRSPEAANSLVYPVEHLESLGWAATPTSRLLFEAKVQNRLERYTASRPPDGDPSLLMVPITEQSTGLLYHGGGDGYVAQPTTQPYQSTLGTMTGVLASASYVTGAHALKVGFSDYFGWRDSTVPDNATSTSYRFNLGVPNLIYEDATPLEHIEKQKADLSIYAQDKWTHAKLTMNLGVRFDYYADYFPAQYLGPGRLVPNRNITFPETPLADWKNVTPRLGVAYDLSGDGKTALRVSMGKYLQAFGLQGTFGESANPVIELANFVSRSWDDVTGTFSPVKDGCDLTNPSANGLIDPKTGQRACGALSNSSFGGVIPSTNYDPATYQGNRGYDWEFSTGIQRQIASRVSLDVSYFRRIYGNFLATHNLAVAPTDYSSFSVTAPPNSALPGGGGYQISGLYNLNPNKVGQVNNLLTLADGFGTVLEHWNGVDLTMSARPRAGVFLQGGVSVGQTMTDDCAVVTSNPQVSVTSSIGTVQSTQMCHLQTALLGQTQVKFVGSYIIPKIKLQLSGTFQSVPGPNISANDAFTSAAVAPSLGRPLSGNAANTTVNLIAPGTMYGERLNQLDWRFSRTVKIFKARAALNLDIYNALNANPVLAQNNNYASWQVPSTILQARFARFNVAFSF